MKVFITGGCKNGKSTFAEKIAIALKRSDIPCYYVATMYPMDEEDNLRIGRHQASRAGLGFDTVEWQSNIDQLLDHYDREAVFLLDSTTALLANEMFSFEGTYVLHPHAPQKVAEELTRLIHATRDVVIVSDYIYADTAFYDDETEAYRKGLSFIDRTCAALCDVVIEVCYGNLIVYKGEAWMEDIYEAIT